VDVNKASDGKSQVIPELVSFMPTSGSGQSQVFTAIYRSSAGGGDVMSTQVMVNSELSPPNSCYFGYDKGRNEFLLLEDSGSGWMKNGAAPGSGTVSNSQCTIDGKRSSATVTGDDLTVIYDVQFKPSFAGPKKVWTNAYSLQSGTGSPWTSEIGGATLAWTVAK
jgi:hypothetical protein